MTPRPPSPVLVGEGSDRSCGRCGLRTNPTVPEEEWDGLCGLCREGRSSSYPAVVTRRMRDHEGIVDEDGRAWERRLAKLLPFDGGRRYLTNGATR